MGKPLGPFVLYPLQLQYYFRSMENEINSWMASERDYLTGLALFDLYGNKPKLSRMLRIGGATVKNRLTLSYELSKIAKHLAVSDKNAAVVKPQLQQGINNEQLQESSEVITIEKLKAQQKMCYKMLDNLHATLPLRELEERRRIAFQILDIDDRLKEITLQIEHFNKHGVIPPAVVKDELKRVSDLSDAQLIQRQMNVRTYITRYKRLVADSKSLKTLSRNQELLDKFQLELDEITERLNK